MYLLQRYVFRSFFFPTVVGMIFFTVVFVSFRMSDLVSMCIEKGVSVQVTLQLFLYMLPFTAALTIPMGVLFGVLISLGQLSENSEIVAMRANGFSKGFVYVPTVLYGLMMTVFMFWFMNVVMPEANRRYKTIYRNVLYTNPSVLLEEREFTDFPGDRHRVVRKISALGVTDKGQVLEDVFLYEYRPKEQKVKVTYANKGEWLNNKVNSPFVSLKLGRGRTLEVDYKETKEMQSLTFTELQFNVLKDVRGYENKRVGLREKSIVEVHRDIQKRLKAKKTVTPRLWVEYHKKYAIPIACLAFVLVAFPLGVTNPREKGMSFIYVIGVIFVYYILMTIGESFGRKAYISPMWGMHIANIVLGGLGIGLFIYKFKR